MKPSVIIIDKIHPEILSQLQSLYGATYEPTITYDDLCKVIGDYDILVISTRMKIDAKILSLAKSLHLIIRMGIGVDHIDLKYCEAHNIKVAITPYANVSPVVELVFGQILRTYRNLELADDCVRAGKFRKDYPHGQELCGKTIGIIGVGRIGSRIATIAKAFGMNTIGVDPLLTDSIKASRDIDTWYEDFNEILDKCQIITLHVPLTDVTYQMVNTHFLDEMQENSVLVNASRGNVVNFSNLFEYKNIDKFRKIIFDVYDEEPFEPNRLPECMANKFYFTPHGGAWTEQSLRNRSQETLDQIKQFLQGENLHGYIDFKKGY